MSENFRAHTSLVTDKTKEGKLVWDDRLHLLGVGGVHSGEMGSLQSGMGKGKSLHVVVLRDDLIQNDTGHQRTGMANLAVDIEHDFSKYRGVLGSLICRFLHVRK